MAIDITSESLAEAQPEPKAVYKQSQPAAISGFSTADKPNAGWRFQLTNSRWTRRNFSRRARELSGGMAIILSVPKSGRTWFRDFLCAFLWKLLGIEFTFRYICYNDLCYYRLIYTRLLFLP